MLRAIGYAKSSRLSSGAIGIVAQLPIARSRTNLCGRQAPKSSSPNF
jgi:hypothetical protein